MEMTIIDRATAAQSAFVAPTLGGRTAGVARLRAVDAHVQAPVQAPALAAGNAGIAMGRRTWSPPIT